jgi:hypothetical protein
MTNRKAKNRVVACPMCNTLRVPKFTTLKKTILCNSPSCIKETLTASTDIPSIIKETPEYLHSYTENFQAIGTGLAVLGRIQAIFNIRILDIESGLKEVVSV